MGLSAVLILAMTPGSLQAEVVFQDDFSEPDGTAINGKSSDIGGTWSSGNAANQVISNAFIQVGSDTAVSFTRALTAGETLTVTLETGPLSQFTAPGWTGNTIKPAAGGGSLNIGDSGGANNEWAETGYGIGTSDPTAPNTVTITYVYDTGEWTVDTTALPGMAAGTGTVGMALSELNFWDDGAGGSELQYQSITAEISGGTTSGPSVTAMSYVEWAVSNQVTSGRFGDEDGDGVINLHEYGSKGDPTNSADKGIPPAYAIGQDGGTNWLYYVYPKRAGAQEDVEYSLWLGDNLRSNTWASSDYEETGTGTNAYADGFDAVSNRIDTSSHSNRFVRLSMTSAQPGFWRGGDISMIPRFEELGAHYMVNGQEYDPIHMMMDCGMNIYRVRLFVVPDGAYDGAIQDLPYVTALGQRIKDAGATFLLDIHYSDTWADPGHQDKPADWAGLSFSELEAQVETYSSNVIATLKAAGCLPDMVQVGNEITGGFLWPEGKIYNEPLGGWANFTTLLKAGIRGVKQPLDEDEHIEIMIHIATDLSYGSVAWYFDELANNSVDFDIIGLSYYPWWHGNLAGLQTTLNNTATIFGKPIVIAETAYPWTNHYPSGTYPDIDWDLTPEGQTQFIEDVMQALHNTPYGLGKGVIWWYPESVDDVAISVWQGGANALFDDGWEVLPAQRAF